jgi:hypothetical protein
MNTPWRLVCVVCLLATVAHADIARDLSRMIGYRIVDASHVNEVQIPRNASGRILILANGQVWHATNATLLPLTLDDVVILEKYGEHVLIVGRDVSNAKLLAGNRYGPPGAAAATGSNPEKIDITIDERGRDKNGGSAEDYERLAERYVREGNNELASAAKQRADAIRIKRSEKATSTKAK